MKNIKFIYPFKILGFLVLFTIATGCNRSPRSYIEIDENAPIFPNYIGVVVPPNICPMNFIIENSKKDIERYYIKMYSGETNSSKYQTDTIIVSGTKTVSFPEKKWKNFMLTHSGKPWYLDIFILKKGQWYKYPRIENFIAPHSIDSYLMYRYIQGSYQILNRCCLMERNLENFDQRALLDNINLEGACLNCHNFNDGNPNEFMLHVRFTNVGTIVAQEGKIEKIQTATRQMGNNCIYPSWHPSGNYIAYSVNAVVPIIHSSYSQYMEAFDTVSDIAILDIKNNTLVACPAVKSPYFNETHPCWSPDGKYLYFTRCTKINFLDSANMALGIVPLLASIHYDLLRARFYEDSLTFGDPEVVVSSSDVGNQSISLPRVSPNGKFLMFCVHGHGTFGSWQRDCDLWLAKIPTEKVATDNLNKNVREKELKSEKFANRTSIETSTKASTGAPMKTSIGLSRFQIWPCKPLNSNADADSYHSWSRNSHWVVFASKRQDGFYTRLYIGYVDSNGRTYKPFMLPIKNPEVYLSEMYLYNICELITGPVPLSQRELIKVVKTDPKQVKYKFIGGSDYYKDIPDGSSGASMNTQTGKSIDSTRFRKTPTNSGSNLDKGFQ